MVCKFIIKEKKRGDRGIETEGRREKLYIKKKRRKKFIGFDRCTYQR